MSRRALRAGSLAILLAAGAAFAGEDWTPCPDNDWEIAGADAAERALVCRGVGAAVEVLTGCGLEVKEAGRVRLVEALPVFCDEAAYGVFDAETREIRLGRPALCVEEAPTGSLFLSLPLEVAFEALAAHEATHALLYAAGLAGARRMEHEYIAGVVQHAVLSPEHLAAALAGVGALPPASEAEFNPFFLSFAPAAFAAKAWLDFEARPDGCGFLRDLATGAARLPDLPEL